MHVKETEKVSRHGEISTMTNDMWIHNVAKQNGLKQIILKSIESIGYDLCIFKKATTSDKPINQNNMGQMNQQQVTGGLTTNPMSSHLIDQFNPG
jgi:hypothetical protein